VIGNFLSIDLRIEKLARRLPGEPHGGGNASGAANFVARFAAERTQLDKVREGLRPQGQAWINFSLGSRMWLMEIGT